MAFITLPLPLLLLACYFFVFSNPAPQNQQVHRRYHQIQTHLQQQQNVPRAQHSGHYVQIERYQEVDTEQVFHQEDMQQDHSQEDLQQDHSQEDLHQKIIVKKISVQQDHSQEDLHQDHSQEGLQQDHSQEDLQQDHSQEGLQQDHSQEDLHQDHSQEDMQQDHSQEDMQQEGQSDMEKRRNVARKEKTFEKQKLRKRHK